jgi:hypothetical protein
MIKLAFGDVISESFRFFFGNLRLFFHLVTIPWTLSVAIRVFGSLVMSDDETILAALVEKTVDILPVSIFLVAWMRVTLLGSQRLDRLPGTGWSARETAFLVHLVQVAGVTFALMATMMLMLGSLDPQALRTGIDPEVAQRQALAAPLAAGVIVSFLLALRVSWGLAGTAVDVPFSPRLSWAYGRGNGWTIVGILFLLGFTGAVVSTIVMLLVASIMRGIFGPGLGVATVGWTAAILASYAGNAVTATAQAIIFRNLLAWREGKPLPPVS